MINWEDILWNIFPKEHLRCAVLCLLQQGAEAMPGRFWGGSPAFPPRQVREENTVNTVSDNSVQAHQGAEADEGSSGILAVRLLGQDRLQHKGRPGQKVSLHFWPENTKSWPSTQFCWRLAQQGMASALKAECTAPLVTRPAIWKLILSGNIMAFASARHVSGQKLRLKIYRRSSWRSSCRYILMCEGGTGERHLLLTTKAAATTRKTWVFWTRVTDINRGVHRSGHSVRCVENV